MEQVLLNGTWEMQEVGQNTWIPAQIPGSVYSVLLAAGQMEDPFYRANEESALARMEKDYLFRRTFTLSPAQLEHQAVLLRCEGLDTLADLFINGHKIAHTDNMHRTWEFEIRSLLRSGDNEISILFSSPTKFIREENSKIPVDGSHESSVGFPHLRKAHCVFGWDWGPRLPDAGIWRDISLLFIDSFRLESVRISQAHEENAVTLCFHPEYQRFGTEEQPKFRYTLTAPDGQVFSSSGEPLRIENPALWWPNGYGAQPLYAVRAELLDDAGSVQSIWECRIGLRTMSMSRDKDDWGEEFALTVNGKKLFSMGGDYIPEDSILSPTSRERTYALLADCAAAKHNSIRVWGGGHYPADWFYDACDELGLVVWQDFMFACAMYELTPAFAENIRCEVQDNVRRLRHHASLGLWCGNNEMEWQVDDKVWEYTPKQKADYIRMYEYLIPTALREVDPDTFYWPASPSSGGGFDDPNDFNRGDVHYWEVWHGNLPFTAYRQFFFRYASEFGFQSFPCEQTIDSFTLPEDRNIFSYVMEKHQRNNAANGKIMNYLAQTFLYPSDFSTMIYASQLLQMEAVRYGVEHWRRHRGRCMGAIYWQVNDCWPVASWSSIDYFGRWKALHYASKRFFAPILLSCCEEGLLTQDPNVNAEPYEVKKSIRLNISNETLQNQTLIVRWALRDAKSQIKKQGEQTLTVPPLSAQWLEEQTFAEADLYGDYVSFALYQGDRWISDGSVLFCPPKHFHFADPHLRLEVSGNLITVTADAYARSVEICCADGEPLFSDNYFDLNAGQSRTIEILRGAGTVFRARSIFDIK